MKGLLITILGVTLLSPDALLVRLIAGDEWTLLFWRGLLFAIGISLLMFIFYRKQTLQQFTKIGKRGLLIAVIFACSTILFVIGLQYTDIANVLVIISTSPVFAAIFSWIFLHEKTHLRTWITMMIIIIAVATIMSDSLGKGSLIGDFCALGNAILIAATLTITRQAKAINMIPSMAISGIIISMIAYYFAPSLYIENSAVPYLLVLSVILTLAFALLTLGPRYISSAEVGLLMPLETLFGILLAWWWLGEIPSNYALLGGAVIIFSLSIHSFLSLKKTS